MMATVLDSTRFAHPGFDIHGRPLLAEPQYMFVYGGPEYWGFLIGFLATRLTMVSLVLWWIISGRFSRFCLAVLDTSWSLVRWELWWLFYMFWTIPGYVLVTPCFMVFDFVVNDIILPMLPLAEMIESIPLVGPVFAYIWCFVIPISPWLRGDLIGEHTVSGSGGLGGSVTYTRSWTDAQGQTRTSVVQEPEVLIGGLSTSLHLSGVNRLRRRSVWVNRLEAVLGSPPGAVGRILRGRWNPDLPLPGDSLAAQLVKVQYPEGVKLLGGGAVRGADKEKDAVVYYILEHPDGSTELVAPELMSHLASYSFLRERSADLVSALRLRALEWCKGQGLSKDATWALLPGSFRSGWEVSEREQRVRQSLGDGQVSPLWWSSA